MRLIAAPESFPTGALIAPPVVAVLLLVSGVVLARSFGPVNIHGGGLALALAVMALVGWLAYIAELIALPLGILALVREPAPRSALHILAVTIGAAFVAAVPLLYVVAA